MKKIFKKLMPLTMAGIMIFGSIAPTFAVVKETETVISNSTQQTEVFYNQESNFEVIVPKLVDLGSDKMTNYEVTVSGDISSDEVIKVVPEESFLMKDKSGTSNLKADVEATVIQDKTEWIFNEFNVVGNGEVSAPNLTAGNWEGSFFFNIKLTNCNIKVIAKNEAGEDLNASATYITGEKKDKLLNSLVDKGFVSDISKIDAIINVESDEFEGFAHTIFDVSGIYKEGDRIVILHFDEEKQQWEYITTETVDSNGLISGDFNSYSPVVFIKASELLESDKTPKEAGLYDANNVMLATWDEAGIDLTTNYTYKTVKTNESSAYYVINNRYPTTTKLVVPDSVNSIGTYAFYLCDSLTNVILSDNVTTIGANAFEGCDNIETFKFPNNLKTIQANTFGYCYNLKEVEIPFGIEKIENQAFSNCYKLLSIDIPDSVISIGYFCFGRCDSLETVVLSNNLTELPSGLFAGCKKLKKVITEDNESLFQLPNNLKEIGDNAFSGCIDLTVIEFPESLEIIGSGSFNGCKNITEINITENIKEIQYDAFAKCYGVKNIFIPKTLTKIQGGTFACGNLETIVVETGHSVYNSNNNCNAIIENSTNKLIAGCANTIIPSNVTSIGNKAFKNCQGLTSITLSDKITTIESGVFENCTNLSYIKLPKNITMIDSGLFMDCISLENIDLPTSITKIETYAFCGCTSLKSIEIPEAVWLINDSAFSDCKSLKELTIPKNVELIGGDVVYGCDSLEKITINNTKYWYLVDGAFSLIIQDIGVLEEYFIYETHGGYYLTTEYIY